jgi:hypothetical protein
MSLASARLGRMNPMLGEIAYSQEAAFAQFQRRIALRDKSVLEIGGAVPATLVRTAGVRAWLAIDPRNEDHADGDYNSVRGRASAACRAAAAFDLAFSSNALEHITDLTETLARVREDLHPGGVLYAHFGPIWSGPDGHHLETEVDGIEYTAWSGEVVAHWAHLACTECELADLIGLRQPAHVARQLAQWICQSDELNRLFFEDYLALFVASGLTLCHLETSAWVDYAYRASTLEQAQRLRARAREKLPGRDLDTREVLAVLRRSA